MNSFLPRSIFCLLIFFNLAAYSQVRFTATLNPSVISADEYTTIRFVIENAATVENINPPSFKDFILINGPLQESGMTNINGVVTNYLAISFVIKTKSAGKFTIPSAQAKISGRNYKSNAVILTVIKNRNRYYKTPNPLALPNFADERMLNSFNDYIFKKGENVADKVNKNMHLRLEVDKKTCFVGEPIVASYKLYTRLKSESKLTQNPSFNGFSVVDLQPADVTASSVEKFNGRDYNVYTIRKAQLYPLQDGTISLESAELENKIQFIKESYARNNVNGFNAIFDDFANATVTPDAVIDQTVVLTSKPVSIVVKPLPENGKPAIFKGAVGKFEIESGLEKNTFPANSSGKLIVMISGSGNLQLITAPVVTWPGGIEAYEPKSSDILSMTSVPISGKKVFEYTFSVDSSGDYILPGLQFSYFDPSANVYRTISTKDLPFSVSPANPRPVIDSGSFSVNKENNQARKNTDPRKWFLFVIGFLVIAGLIIYIFKEKNKDISTNTLSEKEVTVTKEEMVQTSSYNQQNPLPLSEKCLHDPECIEFYSLLMSEIKNDLSSKFNVSPEEINKKTLAEKMDKLNISNETVLSLQQLLQEIEWQLYTPFERNEKMNSLYSRSNELLQLINTYHIRSQ
ncbi:MAG: BatD family protein [Ferruginibacter sp.]